jgi:predicted RNase H-like nuclease (RuvC/YqgF family)
MNESKNIDLLEKRCEDLQNERDSLHSIIHEFVREVSKLHQTLKELRKEVQDALNSVPKNP